MEAGQRRHIGIRQQRLELMHGSGGTSVAAEVLWPVQCDARRPASARARFMFRVILASLARQPTPREQCPLWLHACCVTKRGGLSVGETPSGRQVCGHYTDSRGQLMDGKTSLRPNEEDDGCRDAGKATGSLLGKGTSTRALRRG